MTPVAGEVVCVVGSIGMAWVRAAALVLAAGAVVALVVLARRAALGAGPSGWFVWCVAAALAVLVVSVGVVLARLLGAW